MHLTVLAVAGCPNAAVLNDRLAAVLDGRPEVFVSNQVISDETEAAARGMHGSPTLLIEGTDPFAERGQPPGMSCRLYRDEDGHLCGAPSTGQLRQAIEQALATKGDHESMLMLVLWSAPRSRSTAFYRMMIERGDFTGVHEPFSHVAVFGNTDISGRPVATAQEVLAELRSLAATRQVFVKDTTDRRHPEALADGRFLAEDAQHTFLIRHPRETIRSYLAVRRNPRIHEIGFEAQYEVYTKVRRLTGRDPLVVDAGDLINRPAEIIKAYCAHIGIDFRPHALTWQPSVRPEWQGGFSHWFTNVAASSGLAEVPGGHRLDADQHPMLSTYLAYHLPFYQKLYERRLVALRNSGANRAAGPSRAISRGAPRRIPSRCRPGGSCNPSPVGAAGVPAPLGPRSS